MDVTVPISQKYSDHIQNQLEIYTFKQRLFLENMGVTQKCNSGKFSFLYQEQIDKTILHLL